MFIPDPASHRHAVAAEAGTTVLSFGGPPTFQPSAWEWTFRADPLMRTEPDQAREILAEGLEVHPESGWLYYALACLEAVHGNRDATVGALRKAVALRPSVRELAREDEDFASLRADPEFEALTALS